MKNFNCYTWNVLKSFLFITMVSAALNTSAVAHEGTNLAVAFPDKWMIRAGTYFVEDTDTQVSVNSNLFGLGTTIDYQKDLGGENGETIPRIDAYYRFNERHRIDFTAFSISREGHKILTIDFNVGEENYVIGDEIFSEIKFTLYKLGYNYSFYHSDKVELSLSAGLNITSYDLRFTTASDGQAETAGVSVPLPMFGLRMGYAITPSWSVQFIFESFFINIDDKFRGAILNNEVNTEYRLFRNFAIGAGFTRLGVSADVDDDDWKGSVSDSYSGFTLFGALYF